MANFMVVSSCIWDEVTGMAVTVRLTKMWTNGSVSNTTKLRLMKAVV